MLLADVSGATPALRIGTADDITSGVLLSLTSIFPPSQTLHTGAETLT